MALGRIKRILLGEPLSGYATVQRPISKWKALAVLCSDAFSSVAYASEEILIPLVAFGTAAVSWSIPIALVITALLFVVSASYRHIIDAYPGGGGAYLVAKENLGVNAGLIAAAALMIDYALTVSVSVASSVENLSSAFPLLAGHREALGAAFIFVMMVVNLRALPEARNLFIVPTYLFLLSFAALIGAGLMKAASLHFAPATAAISLGAAAAAPGVGVAPTHVGLWPELVTAAPLYLMLRAFSSGCTALTGIEAVSNGLNVFQPPQQKNAKTTLFWMAVILAVIFLGVTYLAFVLEIHPTNQETAISMLAHAIFGRTGMYYVVQGSTALILLSAANSAYGGFPRLSSHLAKDRFLPRQLASLGDRLVFSNGVFGLSVFAAALLFIFNADTHHLIPLYAVGVFLSFGLGQAGILVHHLREKPQGWRFKIAVNAVGVAATAIVLVVIGVSKFYGGAWIVALFIPFLLLLFRRIHAHYLEVGRELTLAGEKPLSRLTPAKHTVIVPISGIHRGVLIALRYALSISDDVRACYVEIDPQATERIKEDWKRWAHEVPFVVLKSPYRSVIAPLMEYLDDVEQTTCGDMITVVIPEFVTSKWWHQILHNQTAFLIRAALVFRKGKVVTSVRYHLKV